MLRAMIRVAVAALALAAACSHPATMPTSHPDSWPALDAAFLAQSAATYTFKLGQPTPVAIAPDGTVLFRRTPARAFAADLFALAPDGSVRTLASAQGGDEHLSDAERARRERARIATRGVVDVDLAEDGARAMFVLDDRFVVIDRAHGDARTTIDPGGPVYDPHLSPDGKAIAFVRDHDLWVHVIGEAAPRRLTQHPDGFEYGVADFAAQEELNRRRGFWWSPDSTRLVFERVDARGMDTLYVADARHNDRPPVPFKYPRAGRPNAVVDLGVIAIAAPAGTAPTWLTWDRALEYLVSVDWDARGGLTAVVLDRDQQHVQLLALDPAGAGQPRVLVDERDPAWIDVGAGEPRWLPDGSGFTWMTEAPGTWTLQLRDRDGAVVRALTTPELGLQGFVGLVDGAAVVVASSDPTRADVWTIPLAGGAPTRLTDGAGVSGASARHGTIVVTTLLEQGGRATYAVDAKTRARRPLPSVAETPALAPTTRLETVTLDGRTHHVAITRPRAFDPARTYPVLLNVYGGPHRQVVLAAGDAYLMDQWYADAGFIVVRSDNRGTPGRGAAWSRAILRDLATVPVDDQVAALRAVAAKHRELDLARVGVFGWSFGGYLAALLVQRHPELFACGVAGAPVTDWALYDTAYTERYMKRPQDNADGYRRTSVVERAGDLARPLLLIHGITDDNVHFAHALALIEAAYLAGRRLEVITLSATHMVPDPKLALAREQTQIEFFRAHLGRR